MQYRKKNIAKYSRDETMNTTQECKRRRAMGEGGGGEGEGVKEEEEENVGE